MGLAAMFLMETWVVGLRVSVEHRGRPLFSWPAFIIPAYEWTILWAGLSAAFRHAGHVWSADALSPALQRSQFSQRGNHGQILSLSGGERSQVRSGGIAQLSGKLRPVSVVEVEY
jgi:hypothetical protein